MNKHRGHEHKGQWLQAISALGLRSLSVRVFLPEAGAVQIYSGNIILRLDPLLKQNDGYWFRVFVRIVRKVAIEMVYESDQLKTKAAALGCGLFITTLVAAAPDERSALLLLSGRLLKE